MDIWDASIGSIVKYGPTTLRTTEAMGGKLQQFNSKRIRQILHAGEQQQSNEVTHPDEYQKRQTNYGDRRKQCTPTVQSQLHKNMRHIPMVNNPIPGISKRPNQHASRIKSLRIQLAGTEWET